MNDSSPIQEQPGNPLHGLTLEAIVRELEAYFGWVELGERIPV
ncbi:MAG: VF530 family DNA-binding protein, partial [Burkholderiales bacterium]